MAADQAIPVWAWLPEATTPSRAGTLVTDGIRQGRLVYDPDYLEQAAAHALDPVALPLVRKLRGIGFTGKEGLPGVLHDACPSGYGADLLKTVHGRALTALELLELGPGDTVGALEACHGIDAKQAFRAPPLGALEERVRALEKGQSPSRAIRHLLGDGATSAGGERPKATVEHLGRQWLAKMQDRNDLDHLPAKEYVVMGLAAESGITVPPLSLEWFGEVPVFLIERFDRHGDPAACRRRSFASASTAMRLAADSTPGDPRRSYLVLADMLRRWGGKSATVDGDVRELWRRMCFNALVGNADDHPRNHGLLHRDGAWRLSPAFDITPLPGFVGVLRMAVGLDGMAEVSPERLLDAAPHFGMPMADAAAWLTATAHRVHASWAERLRAQRVPDAAIDQIRPAFAMSRQITNDPGAVERHAQALAQQAGRRVRTRAAGLRAP